MKKLAIALASAVFVMSAAGAALAKDKVIAVSWKNFQEERWKTDEAVIKKVVEANGDKYISADAQGSAAKQLSDIESLMSQGADIADHLAPGRRSHRAGGREGRSGRHSGHRLRRADRGSRRVLYMTFDNVGVGRLMAKRCSKVKPEGNFAIIKGDPGDPNADFPSAGQMEVLKPHIDSGKIKIVGEARTDGWKPDNAQKNMEQILTANDNKIDAVSLRERRHGRRRRCRAAAQGLPARSGLRPGRRQCRAEPRCPGHADRVGLEGLPRTRQVAAEAAIELADGKTMPKSEGNAQVQGRRRKGVEMTPSC